MAAGLARRVWGAQRELIEMPEVSIEPERLVALLLDPILAAPNSVNVGHRAARAVESGRDVMWR
jgi:hypothetical protein